MELINHRFWVPLINFSSDISEIKLSEGFVIRKISDYEEEIFHELSENWPALNLQEFILVCEVPNLKPEATSGESLNNYGRPQVENALTILRLFKEQLIGYNLLIHPLSDEERYGYHAVHLNHYALYMSHEVELSRQKYNINSTNVAKLKGFFVKYNNINLNALKLAIEWFNKSYHEIYTPRDSLIDLIISLENLYLKDSKGELGYKLRMRMAVLLGSELRERKEIAEKVKRAYILRSKIIHGGKDSENYYDLFLEIINYARESLKIFLLNPDYRDILDDIILEK